jgi:hypothetical protein
VNPRHSPTHQEAITIIAPVKPQALGQLERVLARLAEDPAEGPLPFRKVGGVHFARFVVIPPEQEGGGPLLLLLLDCDAPRRSRLRRLVVVGAPGLDDVFECCEGYPGEAHRTPAARYAYLREHTTGTAATYFNTVGRTVEQIEQEAFLREQIECFLDSGRNWSERTPAEVRSAIQAFVARRNDLRWALLPAPGPPFSRRIANGLDLARGIAMVIAAAPVALVGALPYAFQLRRQERSDSANRIKPDDAHVQRLAAIEDLVSQNQFTAYGSIKPGRLRRYTAIVILWGVNLGTRHRFNRGSLAGVKTIHAARWVFLDDKRRMIFCSNYDGSLENYMDDFIDKVAWGLNAVFSNGVDYPRTRWLIKDGAKDEQAFKSYIRAHQVPSNVWYTAYPSLTALNIENNARIRAGLSGTMEEDEAAKWLRRF